MRHLIKSEVLQRIKEDEALIFTISNHLGKKFRTVYQWVLDNSEKLQTPAVLQIIEKGLGLKPSEILELEESKAA